jgi:hypothetical protein
MQFEHTQHDFVSKVSTLKSLKLCFMTPPILFAFLVSLMQFSKLKRLPIMARVQMIPSNIDATSAA